MVRPLKQIVDEAYEIFCLAREKFDEEQKKSRGSQAFHYTWPAAVAGIAEKILVNERIEESQNRRFGNKSNKANDNDLLAVCLSNSDKIDLKANVDAMMVLKSERFKINLNSNTWHRTLRRKSWEFIKGKWPFNELRADVTNA